MIMNKCCKYGYRRSWAKVKKDPHCATDVKDSLCGAVKMPDVWANQCWSGCSWLATSFQTAEVSFSKDAVDIMVRVIRFAL